MITEEQAYQNRVIARGKLLDAFQKYLLSPHENDEWKEAMQTLINCMKTDTEALKELRRGRVKVSMSCPRCGGPTFKWERICLSCDSACEWRWAYLDLWSSVITRLFRGR